MKKIKKLTNLLNSLYSKNESTKDSIIKFFKENPNPDDDQVHNLAKELGLEPDDLETQIYSLLSDLIDNKSEQYLKVVGDIKIEDIKDNTLPVGKHNDIPDGQFDPRELKTGIQIEHEHTDDPMVAKSIAKDHLIEISDYYTRLVKMEKEAKGESK